MEKIKVGAVSYLNTKPLLYGINRSEGLQSSIRLIEDYPSKIAAMLAAGSIDVGLVPVAIIPQLREWYIVSDYCIAAREEVASVCMFSEVPVNKIKQVLLDYQSNTSVNLCRVLLKHYWKTDPLLTAASEGYIQAISGETAGVIIGDRALKQRGISKYTYDLGAAWKALTGRPFLFAAWIANKKLPEDFIRQFNTANAEGLQKLEAVILENPFPYYDLHRYYTQNIDYVLDSEKLESMHLFLSYLKNLAV